MQYIHSKKRNKVKKFSNRSLLPKKMPRDKFIIKSSKKLKALNHIHKYCKHMVDQKAKEDLQEKIRFEIKITMMMLDQYIGAENIAKWTAPKNS